MIRQLDRRLLIPGAGLLLAACGGGSSHSVHVVPDPVFLETEPNDTADYPDYVGALRPGSRFIIEGHVTEFGPDVFDGFAFYVDEPCEVEVFLTSHDGADLDFCLYDPYVDEFVACWESEFDPEIGYFDAPWAGEEFHLVVSSYRGDAVYTLEVSAVPLSYAATSGDGRLLPQPAALVRPPKADAGRWDGYRSGDEPLVSDGAQLRGRLLVIDSDGALREELAVLENPDRGPVAVPIGTADR